MADQALYRKYRSADFSQVIGQDHVVKTLTTAIASGRTSHAYLFTGPRGVGKTSVARLLARALNCTGKGAKPCNSCANCLAAINSSLDVVEIDAASNRSIDAVRELRDKIALSPAIGQHKVYIIDEVHMLTSEAFNALLKTLEEPPSHAVFILATTEAHKVPETIISRTQRFSFRPIPVADITAHLKQIAASEKIDVEDAALELLASAARGGFRDAISSFDQIASSGVRPVDVAAVRRLLGYSDGELLADVCHGLAAQDARAALVAIEDLITAGAQPGKLATQLVEQWRQILLASTGATEPADPVVRELAGSVSPTTAAHMVSGLLEVTRSHQPREALEAAVVLLTTGIEESHHGASASQASSAVPAAQAKPQVTTRPRANTPVTVVTPETEHQSADLSADNARWPKVVVIIKQQHNSLAALLAMYPVDFSDASSVVIKSRFNFHRDLFLKPANRSAIEAAAEKVYGRSVNVSAVTDETAAKATPRASVDPSTELISSALEILGGEVME